MVSAAAGSSPAVATTERSGVILPSPLPPPGVAPDPSKSFLIVPCNFRARGSPRAAHPQPDQNAYGPAQGGASARRVRRGSRRAGRNRDRCRRVGDRGKPGSLRCRRDGRSGSPRCRDRAALEDRGAGRNGDGAADLPDQPDLRRGAVVALHLHPLLHAGGRYQDAQEHRPDVDHGDLHHSGHLVREQFDRHRLGGGD